MKINTAQILTTLDGKQLHDLVDGEKIFATLGSVIRNSLLADEQGLSADQKAQRYNIAILSIDSDELDLTIDQLKIAKDCIGKHMSILVAGQSLQMIENAGTIKEVKAG